MSKKLLFVFALVLLISPLIFAFCFPPFFPCTDIFIPRVRNADQITYSAVLDGNTPLSEFLAETLKDGYITDNGDPAFPNVDVNAVGISITGDLNININSSTVFVDGNVFDVASLDVNLTDNTHSFIYVRNNGTNAYIVSASDPRDQNVFTFGLIGEAFTAQGEVIRIHAHPPIKRELTILNRNIDRVFGIAVINGLLTIVNTASTDFNVTSGSWLLNFQDEHELTPLYPTATKGVTWHFHTGSVADQSKNNSGVNFTQWDDGTDLAAVNAGRWYSDFVFVLEHEMSGDSNVHLVIASTEHTLQASAELEEFAAPVGFDGVAVPVARIVRRGDQTDFSNLDTFTFVNDIRPIFRAGGQIGGGGGGALQNIWATIAGDTGSTTTNTTADTLTIAGGTNIATSVSGDTLIIDMFAHIPTGLTIDANVEAILASRVPWTDANINFGLNDAFHDGSTIAMASGEFLDIDVTRSGSETTPGIDMDVTDDSTGGMKYIDVDVTASSTGVKEIIEGTITATGNANINALILQAIAEGSGNAVGASFEAEAQGGGEAVAFVADARDKAGATASTVDAIQIFAQKYIAGSTVQGINLINFGSFPLDAGIVLNADSLGMDTGIEFISGTFTTGIDFNTGTFTGSVIKMTPTQTFSDSTNTYTLSDLNTLRDPFGNDTEVQFNDGGSFGSDSNFTFNSTTDQLGINGIQFAVNYAPPSEPEGVVWWNADEHTLNVSSGLGPVLQTGQETFAVVYNGTGTQIDNGSVIHGVSVFQGFPSVSKAIAKTHETISRGLGVTTMDIPDGTFGIVTAFGKVRGLDTSSFSVDDLLWIDPDVNGGLTNTRPTFPDYDLGIGRVLVSDASEGIIFVNIIGSPIDTTLNFWNGTFRESFDFNITSDGSIVTGSLQPEDSHDDMTMIFNDGLTLLDTNPPVTIVLTAGTDDNPQINYVYIPKSTKVLTTNTSDWPTDFEHIRVSEVLLRSASATQSDGALKNRNWNDHIVESEDERGDRAHLAERARIDDAKWWSGVEGSVNIDSASSPDDVFVSVTGGVVYQFHRQVFDAMDTNVTDHIHVVNDSVSPFQTVTNLNSETTDALGNTLTNKQFSFVVWAVNNGENQVNHLMVNLPICSYLSSSDAISDASNCSVYDIPSDFRGVGFLIARFTFRLQAAGGGTWTLNDTQDLRGFTPNTTAGAGAGGGGVSTILGLTDTPSSFSEQALKIFQVASGETAMEFTSTPTFDDLNVLFDVNGLRGNFVTLNVSGTSNLGNVVINTEQITVDIINPLNDNNILIDANVILGENYLQFPIDVASPIHSEGQIFYDDDSKTFAIFNNEPEITLQIGQEQWIRVRNISGATINDGKAVFINASQGMLPTIELAKADSSSTARVIGVATHDIEDNSIGFVTTFGVVRGIDTSSWDANTMLYLSDAIAGDLTSATPFAPSFPIHIGIVLVSNVNEGQIFVNIGNTDVVSRMVIDELTINKDLNVSQDLNVAQDGNFGRNVRIVGGLFVDSSMLISKDGTLGFELKGTTPDIFLHETDGSANENFGIRLTGGELKIQTRDDVGGTAVAKVIISQDGNFGIGAASPTLLGIEETNSPTFTFTDSNAVVLADHVLGQIDWRSDDVAAGSPTDDVVARIEVRSEGAITSSNWESNLVFYTSDVSTMTEAFRLDKLQNATFAGDITGAGNVIVPTGDLLAGTDNAVQGELFLYGDDNLAGGRLRILNSANEDATIDDWRFEAHGLDLRIGTNVDVILAVLNSSGNLTLDGILTAKGSTSIFGTLDTTAGVVRTAAAASGNTGGRFQIDTSPDHDTTIQSYSCQAFQDDYFCGPNTDTDALEFDGGTGVWHFNNTAGVVMDGKLSVTGTMNTTRQIVNMGPAATTFAITSNVVVLSGFAGGNSITTITGGQSGQLLTIIFTNSLITLVDNPTHAANTLDLTANITGADDMVLLLAFEGTSWYQASAPSVN